jgi:formyl-CoA transferase
VLRIIESMVVDYDLLDIVPGRTGNQNPAVAPSNIYRAADDHWVTVPASTQPMFERLCRALDAEHLVDDERYADNRGRIEHRDELDPLIAKLVADRPMAELVAAFDAEGVAYGTVNTVEDIVHDEHVIARGNLVRVGDRGAGRDVLMQGPVPSFSRTPGAVRSVGPEAGDHTEEVLGGILGLGAEQIARLRAEGIV